MTDYKLINCDIDHLTELIEPNSIDAIITDPPYPKKYLPCFESLARAAAIVLKPGGSLVTMAPQLYLPDILASMTPHIRYNWMCCNLTGANAPSSIIFNYHAFSFWKPIIWFIKDDYKGNTVRDLFKARASTNDKTRHKWEQNLCTFVELVERFTMPGDLILDPFNGAGTTGEAALMLNRNYIGADNDIKAIEISQNRLSSISNLNVFCEKSIV